MLQMEEAQELLRSQVARICDTEQVNLMEACGRVLAEDVSADRDQPPFPRSPLDGYAVRAEDLAAVDQEHPALLRVIGKIYAGSVFEGTVERGQAVRLMTGAPIPEGADTVIRQEDTCVSEDKVEIFVSSKPYKNYCCQGEDYKAGTVLLKKDTVLDAGKIAVLSALGKGRITVYRKPKVAVISTGDEVLAPEEPWRPGKIYDTNRAYISARLMEAGNPPVISRHVSDEGEKVAQAIAEAVKECDLVITTGGVSVGEKDILHEMGELLDARQLFWKVRIKPGSPTLAYVCENTPILCLSGNPFGAIVNFELLARPVLEKLTGQKGWLLKETGAIMQSDFKKPAGVRRFLRGYVEDGKVTVNGRNQASGAIASMSDCNCIIEIKPEMEGAGTGDAVRVFLL